MFQFTNVMLMCDRIHCFGLDFFVCRASCKHDYVFTPALLLVKTTINLLLFMDIVFMLSNPSFLSEKLLLMIGWEVLGNSEYLYEI